MVRDYDYEEYAYDDEDDELEDDRNEDNGYEVTDGCIRSIGKRVVVKADVIVTPRVYLLEPDVDCCGCTTASANISDIEYCCENESYRFAVEQELNLNIPLKFEAEVTTNRVGVLCNSASGCTEDERYQTYSNGLLLKADYFLHHSEG